MKRSPLRRVSKKQRERLKQYAIVRKEYLTANPTCEVCKVRRATDIHHMGDGVGPKRGGNLCNVDSFLAVCRPCHCEIEMNKTWAREQGYLK